MNASHLSLDPALLDRARGVAVGAAIGDALGMPLEFGPRRPPDRLVSEMTDGRLPAGSFTDDTEMALALAESLLAHCPLDPADLGRRFVAWVQTNPPDVGLHTRRVLLLLATGGAAWDEAAMRAQQSNPDSAGNGSLMRCWPVALAYADDPGGLAEASRVQSAVTHAHPDCVDACALANTWIAALLRGMSLAEGLALALEQIPLAEPFTQMVRAAPAQARAKLRNSGWVRHTLESAVWAVTTTNTFEDAVVAAANLGEDADTSGAVAGAIAGAYYGLDGIPERWQAALHGTWPPGGDRYLSARDIAALADRLIGLRGART